MVPATVPTYTMQSGWLVVLLLLACEVARARAKEGQGCTEVDGSCDEDLVSELTDENFLDTVRNADIMVVKFYAPW